MDRIYLYTQTKFAKQISNWAQELKLEVLEYDDKNVEQVESLDGLLLFTENQSLDREAQDVRKFFDSKQKPIQKIDINGTLNVGISNFKFFLERNACKNVLILGNDQLAENPNLTRYLTNLKMS
jgi:hypothetical protein